MRGRHSSFEGDPKGGGARVAGHAGEVRSRRDAKRRARAQLNNGLPYPFLLTRALRLFVPSALCPHCRRCRRRRRRRRRYYSSLILTLTLFYPLCRSLRSFVYLPTSTYLLPTYLTTTAMYTCFPSDSSTLRPISHLKTTKC